MIRQYLLQFARAKPVGDDALPPAALRAVAIWLVLGHTVPATAAERELYVVAGQSNAEGRVRTPVGLAQCPASSKVYRWRAGGWETGRDPWPGPWQGPILEFGHCLSDRRPQATIGIVSVTKGGTSIDQWQRGTDLYSQLISQSRAALLDGGAQLRGIVWYQGESDAATLASALAWPGKFVQLVRDVRQDLQTDAAFVMTVVGPNPKRADFPAWDQLVAAQTQMALPEGVDRVSANDLSGQNADAIHLDEASLFTLAGRWAAAVSR